MLLRVELVSHSSSQDLSDCMICRFFCFKAFGPILDDVAIEQQQDTMSTLQ